MHDGWNTCDYITEKYARIVPQPDPYAGLLRTAFFRRSALNMLGGFDESLTVGECVDFLLRM